MVIQEGFLVLYLFVLVTQPTDLANSVATDKFKVFQTHREGKPFIGIGSKVVLSTVEAPENPIKRALYYKELLESGKVDTHEELASLVGTVRSRVGHFLALLKLDETIKQEVLDLPDGAINERQLRPLTVLSEADQVIAYQKLRFNG